MGTGRSNIRFGLYYKNELVSVMTFSKSNISRKVAVWELNRFASKLNTSVVGGASRLFAAFINKEKPSEIVTYADNRWSAGNLYQQLGFTKQNSGTPNYWYFKPGTNRIHRFNLRKTKMTIKQKPNTKIAVLKGIFVYGIVGQVNGYGRQNNRSRSSYYFFPSLRISTYLPPDLIAPGFIKRIGM